MPVSSRGTSMVSRSSFSAGGVLPSGMIQVYGIPEMRTTPLCRLPSGFRRRSGIGSVDGRGRVSLDPAPLSGRVDEMSAAETSGDMTDGFHLVVDALKLNGVDT